MTAAAQAAQHSGQHSVESTDVWRLAAALDRNGHRWFSSGELKQPERENQTMAENLSMALAELLRKADAEPDVDTLREGVRVMTQALMELEVAQHLGAERVRHVGAQTIPFAERRGSEDFTSGSTAYPRAKARRDRSMPSKREALEDAEGADLRDPRAMVKAVLLEP